LKISDFKKDGSTSDKNINNYKNREKIDAFVDEIMNNSSVSFLKDKNQEKL